MDAAGENDVVIRAVNRGDAVEIRRLVRDLGDDGDGCRIGEIGGFV